MPETISVLIATYNCARFLPQCLNSISAQTRQPDEIIVVDDGSEDGTEELMRRFSGVRYIRCEHNNGKAAAFNRAVAEACGDILCHLDADDYWLPRKLERVCKELADNPTIGGVIHETEHVDENGCRIETEFKSKSFAPRAVVTLHNSEKRGFLYALPGVKGPVRGNPNTTVARRSAIIDLFPLWPDMGLGVDGIFVYGAIRYGILYLPEVLSAYRHHGNNAWLRNPHRSQHVVKMWQFLVSKQAFRTHLSARQVRFLKARMLEMTAYDSTLTGNNKIRGAIAGIQVPLVLLRNGVLFNWRHMALPLMCFLPINRPVFKTTALRAQNVAVGRS
jgi:glycosyltransferase involved in cell wall biosynthesis